MYDVIYYKTPLASQEFIKLLRKRIPFVTIVEGNEVLTRRNIRSLLSASKTDGAWILSGEPYEALMFDLSEYRVPEWDKKYIHLLPIRSVKLDVACLVFDKAIRGKKLIANRDVGDVLGYDIFFISYNESYADQNYEKLVARFPRAKRVHGIKGIHNAHLEAAKLSDTSMFYVVDGDADIVDSFKFDYVPEDIDMVHVWRSINPLTEEEYGYGGVKLLPKYLTMQMKRNTVDMTTSISRKFKAVDEVSNITAFNSDPFSTWRSAFRECVKLSSKLIHGQVDDETERRLHAWCNISDDKLYGVYGRLGALAGREYGLLNQGNKRKLAMINDFDWLKEEFQRNMF